MGTRADLAAVAPVGRPDLVFPDLQLAVFVDGCAWHGCPSRSRSSGLVSRPRMRAIFSERDSASTTPFPLTTYPVDGR